MARIQILELPMEHHGDDTKTPFVIIVDQLDRPLDEADTAALEGLSAKAGARTVLAWDGTLDVA